MFCHCTCIKSFVFSISRQIRLEITQYLSLDVLLWYLPHCLLMFHLCLSCHKGLMRKFFTHLHWLTQSFSAATGLQVNLKFNMSLRRNCGLLPVYWADTCFFYTLKKNHAFVDRNLHGGVQFSRLIQDSTLLLLLSVMFLMTHPSDKSKWML